MYIEIGKAEQPVEQSSEGNFDELNEQLVNLKNQYEELEKINKQLLMEKEDLNNQLSDRSLVIGHHSTLESAPIEDESTTEPKQEVCLILCFLLYTSVFDLV